MSKSRVLVALGQAIREHRDALGITQEELAHRTGLHRTYVGSVERGERNIGIENLVKFAEALGTTPSVLVSSLS